MQELTLTIWITVFDTIPSQSLSTILIKILGLELAVISLQVISLKKKLHVPPKMEFGPQKSKFCSRGELQWGQGIFPDVVEV